ncbi:peptidase S49 [Sphingomonas sp. Leaf357]|nr:peptidase S49 [Sphingomonas sp. Leaf357]
MIADFTAQTQWAMHPMFLDAMLKRAAIETLLPETLMRLAAGFSGGKDAAKPAQPVRDGALFVLPVVGVLAPQGMYAGGTSYETIANGVREAAADSRIGTIILHVRSPGGTVWGCAEAADAIFAARAIKPVIAVASPFSFSAAYWLSTQASKFYVTKSGEVGSVGVRSGHTDMSGFERLLGMTTTLIGSHPDKIAAHPHAPLSDEDRSEIQFGVDESNRSFMRAIARGRGMKLGDVAMVHGTGRTFSARRALSRGAIDGIATLRDVIGHHVSPQGRLGLMRRQAAIAEMAASI